MSIFTGNYGKEVAMSGNGRVAQALFQRNLGDGISWLFLILPDGGWAITRDGEQVNAGVGDRRSWDLGLQKFLSLTSAVPSLPPGESQAAGHAGRGQSTQKAARTQAAAKGATTPVPRPGGAGVSVPDGALPILQTASGG